ncbi:STELLO glycosyltransferase family protein [Flagellimonas onchidii]|uniref:STELLO glycosyltransferase family protein n=1 Tax=Flagellimonas onchidii TaxID=2562684 RepID=UPI0010A61FC6|nr:STELLO glycosyltransferase family protein [Allomuricauda onchidii]
MGKKFIIITSIFLPTKAVRTFAQKKDCELIVVGDKRTPKHWNVDEAIFLSIRSQNKMAPTLDKLLPYNHYSRKNMGYLYAIQQGAISIIDTDDDNIPYEDWSFPNFTGTFPLLKQRNGFVNIYSYYSDQKIWPRGLPLHLINSKDSKISCDEPSVAEVEVGVWQGLADQDPDVDAIYRLVDNSPCIFNKKGNLVLPKGTISPFNSQNTAFRKELFPLLYVPSTVTMRFCDILRGLVAQPILWNHGYHLGVTQATVFQERNEHDFMKDFEQEIPCYLNGEKVVEIVSKTICQNDSIISNLFNTYDALEKNKIVLPKELRILEAWIDSSF